jgi:hypothetical protein
LHVTGLRPGLTDQISRVQASAIGLAAHPGAWASSRTEVEAPAGVWVGLDARLRLVSIGLTLAILGIWVADWVQVVQRWDEVAAAGLPGRDYGLYMHAATHWLATGDFYLASQLQGPYSIPAVGGAILYPPTTLLLLVPFSFLPALLWWAIPLAIIGWAVFVHRPGPMTWPVLAMLLWYPTTNLKLLGGNPTTLWFTAILAFATVRPAASALFFLKPSLVPFALFGARRLSWWITLGATAAVSLPFIGLWAQYVNVLLDARDPSGLLYSLHDVPTMLIPMAIWIGGRRSPLRDRTTDTWAVAGPDVVAAGLPPEIRYSSTQSSM